MLSTIFSSTILSSMPMAALQFCLKLYTVPITGIAGDIGAAVGDTAGAVRAFGADGDPVGAGAGAVGEAAGGPTLIILPSSTAATGGVGAAAARAILTPAILQCFHLTHRAIKPG